MRRALEFLTTAAALSILVGVAGRLLVEPAVRPVVWMGVVAGFAVQLVLFVALFVIAFGSRPLLAHGLGMLGRFLAVGAMAFFWVPWAGVPAAPLLFSAVAVFFLTTVLEPLFLFRHTPAR